MSRRPWAVPSPGCRRKALLRSGSALRAARFDTHLLPQGARADVLDPWQAELRATDRDPGDYRVGIIRGVFVTDDPEAECDAVLSGVAFGQLPDYLAQRHVQARRLVRVLEEDSPAPWDVYVYRPQRGPVPTRVRLVFDAIVEALKKDDSASGLS